MSGNRKKHGARKIKRIRGGTLWTDRGPLRGDVLLDERGRIDEVIMHSSGESSMGDDGSASDVEATGLWVLPGVIDAHVHFRDPGMTEKEDFETGSAAAAAGGVTTVLDMPNTVPPVSSGELLTEKKNLIANRSVVDYGIFGVLALPDEANPAQKAMSTDPVARAITAVEGLIDAGACGIKLFMGPTTGDIRSPEPGTLYQVLKHFSGSDIVFTFHCEDRETIEAATSRLPQDHVNDYSTLLKSRPRFGELTATDAALRLSMETGARVHIAHVALKEAVDAIERAKDAGARVTAETCPQYLFLSEEDYPRLGAMMKVLPPIRSMEDQEALWRGLKAGVIDAISTDHAPHQRDGRNDSPLDGPFGASGVETLLPLMIDAATRGKCTVEDVQKWTAIGPAKAYHLSDHKGMIKPGLDGDIVIIDPNASWKVDGGSWRSKSANTPFGGRSGSGKPMMTIVRGHVVFDHGDVIKERIGGAVC